MAELFHIEKPELEILAKKDRRAFSFSSRPFGLILLFILGTSWIIDFVSLVLNLVFPVAMNDELGVISLTAALLDVLSLANYVVTVLLFLIWIYIIHQDLERLFPTYPISSRHALASVAIPFYNVYGVWKVFETMGKQFLPGLVMWTYALYGVGAISRIVARTIPNLDVNSSLDTAYLLGQLVTLSFISVWFMITLLVHRALAARAAESTTDEEKKPEAAADPLSSKYNAIDVQAGNPAPIEAGTEDTPADRVMDQTTAVPFRGKTGDENRKSQNRWLITGLVGSVLAICAVSACALVTVGTYSILRWFDWNYWEYVLALDDHVAYDDSVATYYVEFSFFQNNDEESEVWLVISLETPIDCGEEAADSCERLANEIASFTLQNYRSIDEMDGLSVTVTTVHGDDADWTTVGLERNMSIAEWRKELRVSKKLDA